MATATNQGAHQRSLRGFLADSAYATLGLGAVAVEFARSVDRVRVAAPRQARTIGRQVPKRLVGAADRGISSVRSLPELATREFDSLSRRGRDLVGAIGGSAATGEAVDRARSARSRVKAAGTSVSRAAEGAVQAPSAPAASWPTAPNPASTARSGSSRPRCRSSRPGRR